MFAPFSCRSEMVLKLTTCKNESITHLFCRFPNMIVACISRGSVRRALLKGIGAEQIISFLRQHCHPQMFKQNPVVPRTVSDQVRFLCLLLYFLHSLFPHCYELNIFVLYYVLYMSLFYSIFINNFFRYI